MGAGPTALIPPTLPRPGRGSRHPAPGTPASLLLFLGERTSRPLLPVPWLSVSSCCGHPRLMIVGLGGEPGPSVLQTPAGGLCAWEHPSLLRPLDLPRITRVLHLGSRLAQKGAGGHLLTSFFCLVSWTTPPLPSLRWSYGEGEAFLAGILGRRREKNGERKLQA